MSFGVSGIASPKLWASRRTDPSRRRRSGLGAWMLRAAAAVAVVSAGYGLVRQPSALTSAATAAPVQTGPAQTRPGSKRIILAAGQSAKIAAPRGRARTVRSVLDVPGPLNFGDYVWEDKGVPAGRLWIRVDRDAQIISVFRAGHEIGTAVILYGATEKPTPSGTYPIIWRRRDHRSSLYDAPMPYTLRLTGDGVAIHGSDVRRGRATHGCVGVPIEFARLLFAQAKLGDHVDIV